MQRISALIGGALFVAVPGMAEILITADDHAVDSDVVLESVVKEVKSVPGDTVQVVEDLIIYAADETISTINGVKSIMEENEHDQAQQEAMQAVEEAWPSPSKVHFRSYAVTGEVGSELMEGAEAEAGSVVNVSGAFMGMEFPPGTSAYYRPDFRRLIVRQTMENMLIIEDVLSELHHASRELRGHQIEIETKFVEVSQTTLNELGFSWTFDGKGSETATGGLVDSGSGDLNILDDLWLPAGQELLSDTLRTTADALGSGVASDTLELTKTVGSLQWSLAISALEQSDDSDVLSAPRVVTRDGSTAIIQVGEEQMLPRSFNVPSQNTNPFIEHSDWELDLIGVYMEVTPELREGDLIDLELHPVIKEVIGQDSYRAVEEIGTVSGTGASAVSDTPALFGSVPYFRIRELETRVTVADGSTVGMGGLIYDKLESYHDEVPVLGSLPFIGRLFRSEGESSVKRNLMIFVTASQVDVHGRTTADIALRK